MNEPLEVVKTNESTITDEELKAIREMARDYKAARLLVRALMYVAGGVGGAIGVGVGCVQLIETIKGQH